MPGHRSFLGVDRSLSGCRWIERLDGRGRETATAIAQQHGLPEIVARILAGRGIGIDDAARFLDPTLRELLPDPAVLTDMDAAAERLADGIARGETIAVYGDYDVDGATSSALMVRFLRHQGIDARIYIPDRIFEGYGPNPAAIRQLAADSVRLIITVDCGSTSFEALEEARGQGVDVVVLDHHEMGVERPSAVALVNPNRQDDLSGLGHLAAVGVTFLAIVAVNRVMRQRGWYGEKRSEPELLQWLDLVAFGTVCDVVPLQGLNRAFVVKGLAAMARRANRGIAALADVARLSGPVSPYYLGFILGPRINAGGRIGEAGLGARLLASDDAAEAQQIAAELERLNAERQAMENRMLEEAIAEAEAEIDAGGSPDVVVTANPGWHPGIVGLIASRLKDRFRRPAVAIALRPDGMGTGSARSVPGFDIGRAVRAAMAEDILVKGGGHPMAAGLTVSGERLGELRSFLASAAATAPGDPAEIEVDAALTARGATYELIEDIQRAGPYGAGHAEPVFVLPNHRLTFVDVTEAGHMRLTLAGGDKATIKGIAFRVAGTDLGDALQRGRGELFHFAGNLTLDRWRERVTPGFRVVDMAAPTG